ncbi:MAG: chemotaxis protein CheB [Deltaproteobacteria bacterium]
MQEEAEQGNQRMIKVLLVDDSPIAIMLFKRMLAPAKDISVVGTAGNGKEALDLIPRVDPAVICTDLHMPVMDGLQLTKEVMKKFPKPILVASVSVLEGSQNVFDLLDAGAVDIFQKPRGGTDTDYMSLAKAFQRRIRILAGVHVFRRFKRPVAAVEPLRMNAKNIRYKVVVIGSSTGGPQALQQILSHLPADFPIPVICVQHIENGFLGGFIDWLQATVPMKASIAVDGEVPQAGRVYFPPEQTHLVIDERGRLRCTNEGPFDGHRPSITVTFKSAAERFGNCAIGVILTGMGRDGASGMKAISEAGGATIAQNEESSVVFSMPRHAIEIGAAGLVLPIDQIPAAIITQAKTKI